MKKRKNISLLTEGVYDFYNAMGDGKFTTDKIISYYIDKIRKYGKDSLTASELEVFNDANNGELPLDRPIYKKNKVTGDMEFDNLGLPIRIDKEKLHPGVPFLTSKGKGINKKEAILNARCYWFHDDANRTYYAYIKSEVSDENPNGLVIYKTISETGKEYGTFMNVKKSYLNLEPSDLWSQLNDTYDKGIILNDEIYKVFSSFNSLYHESIKKNAEELKRLYTILRNYSPQKKR